MRTPNHKRVGTLFFNQNNFMPDIRFPNGAVWGGLHEGTTFEVLNDNGVWVHTRLMSNGYTYYLQGVTNSMPLGRYVRI